MNASPKIAIVTGASSGIGRAIVLALAAAGWHVAYSYVGDDAGAEETARLAEKYGVRPLFRACDAGIKADVDAFHDAAYEWAGTPDLLVNNAGIQTEIPLLDLAEDDWDRVIRTNLKGCFLNTQVAARRMREAGKGGAIVNIGSGCNKAAFPLLASYAASKGAIDQFTRSAALELGAFGIRVNCVAPGAIFTERTANEGGDYSANWSRLTPMGRIGTPDDVAGAVLYFASPAAAFVSAQTLYIDGGVFSRAIWPNA